MATAQWYIKPPPGLEDLVEQRGEVLSLSALIPKDSRARVSGWIRDRN